MQQARNGGSLEQRTKEGEVALMVIECGEDHERERSRPFIARHKLPNSMRIVEDSR